MLCVCTCEVFAWSNIVRMPASIFVQILTVTSDTGCVYMCVHMYLSITLVCMHAHTHTHARTHAHTHTH